MSGNEWEKDDRRQYIRIKKHFILAYYDKEHPEKRFDASQLKNISLGGMCFLTSQYFKPASIVSIELKTPYLTGTVYLEGKVLGCVEKLPKVIYETRLQFDKLSTQAEFVLNKIVEYYKERSK